MEKYSSETEPRKPESKKEEWWREYSKPLPGESAEGYLDRVRDEIVSTVGFDMTDFRDKNIPPRTVDWNIAKEEMLRVANILLDASPTRMSNRMLSNGIKTLDSSITSITNKISNAEDKVSYFKQTNQERFLYKNSESEETILYSIFGIPNGYVYKDVQSIFEKRINDRTILVFGGGNSLYDLLTDSSFKPKALINIDPYITSESVEKNKRSLYQSISLKAEDPELKNELKKKLIDRPEEIWATYSVPCYLETVEDIHNLFKNVDEILVPGGYFRVYPLAIVNFMWDDERAFSGTDNYSKREDAWVSAVKNLVQTGRYNLEVFNNVMHLQKLEDVEQKYVS